MIKKDRSLRVLILSLAMRRETIVSLDKAIKEFEKKVGEEKKGEKELIERIEGILKKDINELILSINNLQTADESSKDTLIKGWKLIVKRDIFTIQFWSISPLQKQEKRRADFLNIIQTDAIKRQAENIGLKHGIKIVIVDRLVLVIPR